MDELVIVALRIMEKRARYLRLKVQKGEKFGWEEVKPIVRAAGELLDSKDVKDEVRKINWLFLVPLNTFIDWAKDIKLKGQNEDT